MVVEEIMAKVVVVVLLILMVASLVYAGKQLYKSSEEESNRAKFANALKVRIGIWVVLFAFIIISMKMGWIKPSNSPNPANFNQEQQKRIDEKKEEK